MLTGCGTGTSHQYAHSADGVCKKAIGEIAALDAPTTGILAVSYAIDRYVIVERVVARLDARSVPGALSPGVEDNWLAPARRSLDQATADLEKLRDAVNAKASAATTSSVFDAAVSVGTEDVDTAYLSGHGLPQCATLFGTEKLPSYPASG
jgi:hypothetical protein